MVDRELQGLSERIALFSETESASFRVIALYAAAVTTADGAVMRSACILATENGVTSRELYEVMLQSYLFLGFPRMLIAARNLNEVFPSMSNSHAEISVRPGMYEDWKKRGEELYKEIYGSVFETLRKAVISASPEVFEWMIVEGYGKVLSREGLNSQARELANVAFLMMDNRPEQLFSHMRGAVNMGVTESLLRMVVEDIGTAAGEGYGSALSILPKLKEGVS